MISRIRGFRALACGVFATAGLALAPSAFAGVSVGINLPGLSIGVGPHHHAYLGIGGGYYAPSYYDYGYYPAPVVYDDYYYGAPVYVGGYYGPRHRYHHGGYYRGGGEYHDYHHEYHHGGYYDGGHYRYRP